MRETERELRPLVVITRELLKDYAEASGDHNPIHQDEAVARSMGLPGIIAHGMLVAGRLHQKALEALTADGRSITDLKSSKTKFRAMTLLGDELQYSLDKRSDGEVVHYDLQAFNGKQECVVTATFKV